MVSERLEAQAKDDRTESMQLKLEEVLPMCRRGNIHEPTCFSREPAYVLTVVHGHDPPTIGRKHIDGVVGRPALSRHSSSQQAVENRTVIRRHSDPSGSHSFERKADEALGLCRFMSHCCGSAKISRGQKRS